MLVFKTFNQKYDIIIAVCSSNSNKYGWSLDYSILVYDWSSEEICIITNFSILKKDLKKSCTFPLNLYGIPE